MKKLVKPSRISGEVTVHPSKSVVQRAIAAALLDNNTCTLHNFAVCDDAVAALRVAGELGATISRDNETVSIKGGLHPSGKILRCGEAGLCIRMFTPIASLVDLPLTLTGEGSLLSRPVAMIEKPLRDLGVSCRTNNGLPPIQVQGPLQGGNTTVDGSLSSQFLTGLLLALPLAKKDSYLTVIDLKSIAYIDITLNMLRQFGIEVEHTNYETFYIRGNQRYSVGDYTIEGDWSGAAFLLVAGAIAGSVLLFGLDSDSPQADRKIIPALQAAGADVAVLDNKISITTRELHAFDFDATHCPDLFPPLVALACNCDGTTTISGVERLRFKESDRATTLVDEFSKIGTQIAISGNRMEVRGGRLQGGAAKSHHDHRIAMALAVAALTSENGVMIENAESVSKSFPTFFEKLQKLGGNVDE